MPHTYICFVWHMHQPFYKDLASGEYRLPWTRLHALKDYYGMVKILDGFPEIRQTFNLVPSMMLQIEEYAKGEANDPFLRLALRPAESLTPDEQITILRHFFLANPSRMIYRFPRYGELYDTWRASGGNAERARLSFLPQAYRDLQVLSQLAWFDEEYHDNDEDIRELTAKGRGFSLDDQALMGRKQRELLSKVLPVYSEFRAKGQVEISVTPYYHPILPLLCDSNIASVSHPNVQLPPRFRHPEDAKWQIESARAFIHDRMGFTPDGMWPSEGSVSDETLALAAECGVKWMATDNGVLGASLARLAGVDETYRPWLWKQGGKEMRMLFRDHFLSDLIGFVYSRMEAEQAADHFLARIRENCQAIHAQGRDALVPVILDGENAWEHFERGGRAFLRGVYRRISEDPSMSAVTVGEALEKVPAAEMTRIHPGSWINANFDIWIGAEEDNKAWGHLLEARRTYAAALASPAAAKLKDSKKELAKHELMIAEGSDWFWWYGPEHHSENRPEFDKLFRDHLANVYRALDLTPPEELSRPILSVSVQAHHEPATGFISPRIDGEVSSYFEWLGAGLYRPDHRQGSMHGMENIAQELMYGSDGEQVFVRLDLKQSSPGALAGLEVRVSLEGSGWDVEFHALLTSDGAELLENHPTRARVRCSYRRIFELAVDLGSLGMSPEGPLRIQTSVWRDGLPLDAVPAQGWLEFIPGRPEIWGV